MGWDGAGRDLYSVCVLIKQDKLQAYKFFYSAKDPGRSTSIAVILYHRFFLYGDHIKQCLMHVQLWGAL